MNLRIGKATVNVSISDEDMGGEFPGECCWNMDVASLRRILAVFPDLENSMSIPDSIGNAIEEYDDCDEEIPETLADLPDDYILSFRDADSGIVLAHAMGAIGGEWAISWEGEGEMWFFHDWDHATHDAYEDGKNIAIQIDGDREERAYVAGARGAIRNGADIGDVCNELASVVEPFTERFGYAPSRMWNRIFEGFTLAESASV